MATASEKIKKLIPDTLELQKVPLKAVLITMAVSVIAILGAQYAGFPLWGKALAGLLPWAPIFFFESAWKYEQYGFYALMAVFVILQIGHLAEHSVQVGQLLWFDGDVTVSHGVFGELDRELVHFGWDTLVWLGVGVLLYKIGPHNKWLWIAFFAASFHEVEHVFLYYLDRFQPAFYEAGGTTGLLAKGGLIGTPLQRPYLHYVYNFFVVVPLIMAFWDETKRAYNIWLAKALPNLTEQERISTTAQLETKRFDPGQVIVRQGETADNFYIVARGLVEVVRETGTGQQLIATLGPGQFFGEMGLLTGNKRMASVKAIEETEVLALDKTEFGGLVTRSQGGAQDIESIQRLRARQIDLGAPSEPPAVPPAPTAPSGTG
jgi:hypothetical protein